MWHPVTGGVLPTHMCILHIHTLISYSHIIYYITYILHTFMYHVCVCTRTTRMYVKVSGGK